MGWRNPSRILLCALVALLVAPATALAQEQYPPGFRESTVVGGLTQPTAIAWAPDGRRFVVEKPGVLKVAPPGTNDASEVLDLTNQVNSSSDRGLLGVAVDAQFAANGYLYLLYTHERLPLTPDTDEPMTSKLQRLKVDSANAVVERTTILGTYSNTNPGAVCPAPSNSLDCIPSDGTSHSIGTVRADPDGTLWVGSGDAAGFGGVEPLAFRSYDEQSMAGKIMHVNRNGQGLAAHSFCPGETNLSRVCTKLFAKGFRNPFRFSLRPEGAGLTVGDVGWTTYEEVNLISAGGRSYGWPCYEGNHRTNGYVDQPQCPEQYAKEGTSEANLGPAYEYPHDDPENPGSTDSAAMGGPTYVDGNYPTGYRNSIFFADYAKRFIRRLVPQPGGGVAVHPQKFATKWTGVDLQLSPAGNLVYVTFGAWEPGTGRVTEIVYTPDNANPEAVVTATPLFGNAPLEVDFDATGSDDVDGDTLSYSWDFGDGSAASNALAPTHTYDEPGSYTATLTVSDGNGGTDEADVVVDVANTPPVVSVQAADTYRGGEQVAMSATAQDAQDGTLPPSAIDWNVKLVHETHDHFATAPSDTSAIQFRARDDHDLDSHYEAQATATDSNGRSASAVVRLDPEPAPLLLGSDPSGVLISYGDGKSALAPFTGQAAVGFKTTVSVPPTHTAGSQSFDFRRWADGIEQNTRNVVVPPQGLDLRAVFAERKPPPSGDQAPPAPVSPNPTTGPPASVDTKRPRLSVNSSRALDIGLGRVTGRSRDTGGTKRVEVAVYRRARQRRCRWWLPAQGRLSTAPRSCRRPIWIPARLRRLGTGSVVWVANLRRRNIAPGSYRLLVRGVDRAGNEARLDSLLFGFHLLGRSTL